MRTTRERRNGKSGYIIKPSATVEAADKLAYIENLFPEREDFDRMLYKTLNKVDVDGVELKVGDVVRSIIANVEIRFVICFGEYDAYCPMDKDIVPNIGYYAYCIDEGECCPLGTLNLWAQKIGNIADPQYREEAREWQIPQNQR